MERDVIMYELGVAIKGSRRVRITFKRDAIGDIVYLLGMSQAEAVDIDGGAETALTATHASYDWQGDSNRTVTLTLTFRFDENWFADKLGDALEKIEAVK